MEYTLDDIPIKNTTPYARIHELYSKCVLYICEKKLSTSFHSAYIIINDFACPVSICYLVAYTAQHTYMSYNTEILSQPNIIWNIYSVSGQPYHLMCRFILYSN